MYDKILRESFENLSHVLLHHFFPGLKSTAVALPNTMRQHIKEQEADAVLRIEAKGEEEFIFHLEFQKGNDRNMAKRMASYDFMLHLKYNANVIGMVIYIGEKPMKMDDTVSFNDNYYRCEVMDIRKIDAELFLKSDKARETVLAILGSYKMEDSRIIIQKILARLHELLPHSPAELKDRLKELEIVSQLRSKIIQEQILEEEKNMPIHFDIKKDLRYQQGLAEGMTKGVQKGERRGKREGRREGRLEGHLEGKQEGKEEGRLEGALTTALTIAKAFLNSGYSIDEVNKNTGIELSVLHQLLNTRD